MVLVWSKFECEKNQNLLTYGEFDDEEGTVQRQEHRYFCRPRKTHYGTLQVNLRRVTNTEREVPSWVAGEGGGARWVRLSFGRERVEKVV